MANQVVVNRPNGNGHAIFPLNRKAFHRSLPRRLVTVEDTLDEQQQRLDDFVCRLTTVEQKRVASPGIEARVNNVSDIVIRLAACVGRIDRRSARSRRKIAVIADQLAD